MLLRCSLYQIVEWFQFCKRKTLILFPDITDCGTPHMDLMQEQHERREPGFVHLELQLIEPRTRVIELM